MGGFWFGFEFVIGGFLALVVVAKVAPWLRYRWYVNRPDKPDDIRKRCVFEAIALLHKQKPKMSPAQRQDAMGKMLSLMVQPGQNWDQETLNALTQAATFIVRDDQ